MADIFNILAEAKIREWQDRPQKEKSAAASGQFQQSPSYEKQILDEVIRLIESAKGASEEMAARTLASSRDLEVQLMASLEQQGLNLAARRIAQEIEECRRLPGGR